jgi:hypothetical protein
MIALAKRRRHLLGEPLTHRHYMSLLVDYEMVRADHTLKQHQSRLRRTRQLTPLRCVGTLCAFSRIVC